MFRRLLRNKIFLGTACILLALIVGFGVVPAFNAGTRKTVKVYRAKDTIYEYQQITDSMIEQVEVGAYGLPKDVIKDKKGIVGKIAKTKIVKNDNILPGQLMSASDNIGDFLNEISLEGKRAISVTLPKLSSSLSGMVISGDVVSVLTFDNVTTTQKSSSSNGFSGNNGYTTTKQQAVEYPDLKYLQIGALSAQNGQIVNGLESTQQSADGKENVVLPSTVTFICNDQQAEELAEIEKKGDMQLLFVARGAKAEQLIQQQNK